jgi:predicted transcriptional regulator
MNYTITTTLESSIYNFLDNQAKTTKKTKKSIIEDALKMYQKYNLKNKIEAGLAERYNEYKEINNDFVDIQFNSLRS